MVGRPKNEDMHLQPASAQGSAMPSALSHDFVTAGIGLAGRQGRWRKTGTPSLLFCPFLADDAGKQPNVPWMDADGADP